MFDETEYLKFQEKAADSPVAVSSQVIYSKPEYTVINETDLTVWVEDQDGQPHVFTREEWEKMQGKGGAGLLAIIAAAAGLLLFA